MDAKTLEGGRMAMMKSGENLIRREQAKAYLEGQKDSIEREEWEQMLLEDEDIFFHTWRCWMS